MTDRMLASAALVLVLAFALLWEPKRESPTTATPAQAAVDRTRARSLDSASHAEGMSLVRPGQGEWSDDQTVAGATPLQPLSFGPYDAVLATGTRVAWPSP